MVKMSKLTTKQSKFCIKYSECCNASEAYRHTYNAGRMKPETINNKAYELLNRGDITARISELQNELKERSDINKDEIIKQLSAIIRSDIRDYVDFNGTTVKFKSFDKLTDAQACAIESVKEGKNGIELKLHGKSWSIERICKMLGYEAPIKTEQKTSTIVMNVIKGDIPLAESEDEVVL